MKQLTCEMCGSTNLIKQDGMYVCQSCGTKYSVEEAKKMMIEGTVDVSGSTVKLDNSSFVEKYLENARRARFKKDWAEVEKYYNMVEQSTPQNIEAVFYSSYGKLRCTLLEDYSAKWDNDIEVLKRSISVLDDYFDMAQENEQKQVIFDAMNDILVLTNAAKNNIIIGKMTNLKGEPVYSASPYLEKRIADLYPQINETLDNIITKYKECNMDYSYLISIKNQIANAPKNGCYVATAVYGSYDCPQVWTLRRYRDYTLAKTWYGRAFIHTYYAISPTIVKWFGDTDWFKKMWKGKLDRMVANLQEKGVEDTPYEDREW